MYKQQDKPIAEVKEAVTVEAVSKYSEVGVKDWECLNGRRRGWGRWSQEVRIILRSKSTEAFVEGVCASDTTAEKVAEG